MSADYIIRQGEPLNLELNLLEGDEDTVVSVTAKLKKAGPNATIPSKDAAVAATFTVAYRTNPSIGWDISLTPEITSALSKGIYVADAKLTLTSGGPLITDYITIEIKPSVT